MFVSFSLKSAVLLLCLSPGSFFNIRREKTLLFIGLRFVAMCGKSLNRVERAMQSTFKIRFQRRVYVFYFKDSVHTLSPAVWSVPVAK